MRTATLGDGDARGTIMRIEGPGRAIGGGGSTRPAAATGFRLSDAMEPQTARASTPARAAPGLDALIALQAVAPESMKEKRRRAMKRGRSLLDALDGMKLALVQGTNDPSDLRRLVAGLRDRPGGTGDAGLDEVIAAIELRAEVEIAKRGG